MNKNISGVNTLGSLDILDEFRLPIYSTSYGQDGQIRFNGIKGQIYYGGQWNDIDISTPVIGNYWEVYDPTSIKPVSPYTTIYSNVLKVISGNLSLSAGLSNINMLSNLKVDNIGEYTALGGTTINNKLSVQGNLSSYETMEVKDTTVPSKMIKMSYNNGGDYGEISCIDGLTAKSLYLESGGGTVFIPYARVTTQLLVNDITSISGDDNINFSTSGNGKFYFNASPLVNTTAMSVTSPISSGSLFMSIGKNTDILDGSAYIGYSVSGNQALFGLRSRYDIITGNSSYQTDINGSGYIKLNGPTYVNNLYENTLNNGVIVNSKLKSDIIEGKTTTTSGNIYGVPITTSTISADNIVFSPTSPTSLRDLVNTNNSAGLLAIPTITDNLDGTISVATCNCQIRTTNSTTGIIKFLTIAATSSPLTITQNSTMYLIAIYNSGNPIWTISSSMNSDYQTQILAALIYRVPSTESNELYINTKYASIICDNVKSTIISSGVREGNIVHGSGCNIGFSGLQYSLTSGNFSMGINNFTTNSKALSDGFKYLYHLNGTFVEGISRSLIDNLTYDDGTNLQTMISGRWSCAFVYVTTDTVTKHYLIYSNQQVTSSSLALALALPSSIPQRLLACGILVGKIVFQKSSNISQVLSSFTSIISYQGVTSHSSLANLTSDDHTQYALLSGRTSDELKIDTISSTSNVINLQLQPSSTGANIQIGNSAKTCTIYSNTDFYKDTAVDNIVKIGTLGLDMGRLTYTYNTTEALKHFSFAYDTNTPAIDCWQDGKNNGSFYNTTVSNVLTCNTINTQSSNVPITFNTNCTNIVMMKVFSNTNSVSAIRYGTDYDNSCDIGYNYNASLPNGYLGITKGGTYTNLIKLNVYGTEFTAPVGTLRLFPDSYNEIAGCFGFTSTGALVYYDDVSAKRVISSVPGTFNSSYLFEKVQEHEIMFKNMNVNSNNQKDINIQKLYVDEIQKRGSKCVVLNDIKIGKNESKEKYSLGSDELGLFAVIDNNMKYYFVPSTTNNKHGVENKCYTYIGHKLIGYDQLLKTKYFEPMNAKIVNLENENTLLKKKLDMFDKQINEINIKLGIKDKDIVCENLGDSMMVIGSDLKNELKDSIFK